MTLRTCTAALLALTLVACAGDAGDAASETGTTTADTFTAPDTTQMQRTASGLYLQDLEPGTGEPLQAGQTAVVHYTGWLTDGSKFDSSRDRNEPFAVENVGSARVIDGWNEGLQGMRAGGHRLLLIPSELAYGPEGMPPVIPPSATLVFRIELLEIR